MYRCKIRTDILAHFYLMSGIIFLLTVLMFVLDKLLMRKLKYNEYL